MSGRPDEDAARRKRNVAIAVALVAFAVVVFAVTLVQMARHAA